ncbi:MAG: MmgE/PrpD family protein [Acetobacteraceae bacterium]|nr:MmgE/PrpD family protein [Acetobacteraceae bacterium]
MAQLMTEPLSNQQREQMRSAVERIAEFAAASLPERLTPDIRQLYKRNILDSLGCAIAALPGPPFKALREQFEEYRAPGRCTLIGGGKTSADQAALFNSGLTRYVDLLDSYMANGGLCHPSDNFGAVLAAAEQAGASGEEFMLALAVSYEIQCRFTAVVPVMAKGFNHATQLAISGAASAGKLFGLSSGEIANAISIATADNVSLACIHVEPVSQWKGFSPGWTGMRAVYAASMAKRGFTGPVGLFEGPWGLEYIFAQSIPVNWEDPSLEIVKQTVLKKYCSLIHGQPVIEATLDLKRSNGLAATDVEHVRCETFQAGFDFAGGGTYGSKDHPWMKEQGDYNLKYLISAALLDDQVGPDQLTAERVQSPDAQAMVARIEVRPDPKLTARFPQELAARITVRTKDNQTFVKEHLGYEGGLDKPMSWDRVVEKFHWLSERYADEELRNKIIEAVQKIDSQPISDLMSLLGQVRQSAVYPKTRRGI